MVFLRRESEVQRAREGEGGLEVEVPEPIYCGYHLGGGEGKLVVLVACTARFSGSSCVG